MMTLLKFRSFEALEEGFLSQKKFYQRASLNSHRSKNGPRCRAPLGMIEISKFLIWMMIYDKTNGNQSGYHEFLHFWHIEPP